MLHSLKIPLNFVQKEEIKYKMNLFPQTNNKTKKKLCKCFMVTVRTGLWTPRLSCGTAWMDRFCPSSNCLHVCLRSSWRQSDDWGWGGSNLKPFEGCLKTAGRGSTQERKCKNEEVNMPMCCNKPTCCDELGPRHACAGACSEARLRFSLPTSPGLTRCLLKYSVLPLLKRVYYKKQLQWSSPLMSKNHQETFRLRLARVRSCTRHHLLRASRKVSSQRIWHHQTHFGTLSTHEAKHRRPLWLETIKLISWWLLILMALKIKTLKNKNASS